ncbi:hypothetical protein [Mycoplasma leonicaptivi]|uniref:hypothetical protein n=1 Tax=Mycoplasma leonicaptivi TaxID=36742 RepID=UPI0004825BA8|nr:hypothetical protein [Mycoplasma leonicaptivi]
MSIENILNNIVKLLRQSDLSFDIKTGDGRIDSKLYEEVVFIEIIRNPKIKDFLLKNKINFNKTNIRDWYDISFENNEYFIPINIKVSNLEKNQSDNLNSKLGIYYALTGKIPHFQNEIKWEDYFKELYENIQDNNKDYYFIIINKNNSNDIFWTSLKRISSLVSNGNNLPFQCVWNNNRIHKNRNFNDSKNFILKKLEESITKRAKIYFDFKKYFS